MVGPWMHRIDAVPRPNRPVEFLLTTDPRPEAGLARLGMTRPATEVEIAAFTGIGAEVAYQTGSGHRHLSNEVAYWRYV